MDLDREIGDEFLSLLDFELALFDAHVGMVFADVRFVDVDWDLQMVECGMDLC